MTKLQLRILGGIIILISLMVIGSYEIEGIIILLMTVGVAVFFELVLVKNFATDKEKPSQS